MTRPAKMRASGARKSKGETLLGPDVLAAAARFPDAHLIRVHSGVVRVKRGYMHLAPEGTADYLGIGPGGRALACELKVPGGKQSPEQITFADLWRRKGGIYCVVHSAAEFFDAVMDQRGDPFVGRR